MTGRRSTHRVADTLASQRVAMELFDDSDGVILFENEGASAIGIPFEMAIEPQSQRRIERDIDRGGDGVPLPRNGLGLKRPKLNPTGIAVGHRATQCLGIDSDDDLVRTTSRETSRADR